MIYRRAALAALVAIGCAGSDVRGPLDVGDSPEIGRPVLGFLWKQPINDQTGEFRPQEFASPVVVSDPQNGEVVYVGTHGGWFHALSAWDGRQIWKARAGSTSTRAVIERGLIYVGTDDGALVVLDKGAGTEKWKHGGKGPILQPPVLVGDTIIFANGADTVIALDHASGAFRWQYERDTPEEFTLLGHAGVALGGDTVYAGFADGHVVALTAAAGEVVWVRSLAGDARQFVDVDTTPVVAGGVVYAASSAGGLYALDATDGSERWRLPITNAANLVLDGETLYVTAAESGVHAVDLAGNILWRQGLNKAGDPARPVVSGDYLLVSTSSRGLYVIDKLSGALVQHFDPGLGISAPPGLHEGRLFLLSNGGLVYAMNLRDMGRVRP